MPATGKLGVEGDAITGPASDLGKWLDGQKAKVVGRSTTFHVEVTPAMALAWLRLNAGNRNPSKAKIRRFSAAMKAGRWTLNGETVKFSATGRLIDGQSRLMAAAAAGRSVTLEIRSGLPDEAQKSMDIGELRKGAHTLEMMGEKYPVILAPALKLIWLLEHGLLGGNKFGSSTVMENYDVAPLLTKHDGLKSSVGWVVTSGAGLSKLVPAATAAFFHYVFGTIDQQLRDEFFSALAEGVGLTKSSPVYHLRERLLDDRAKKLQGARKREHRALVIIAWNASRLGDKMTGIRFAVGQTFPEIDGYKPA